jgi:integrase
MQATALPCPDEETAHRAMQNCGQVFRYAVATGRAERDPTADLRGALPPPKGKHHASIIEPKRIGELLRAIDAYEGFFTTKFALRLAPLVFVRPGELRQAQWPEIDLGNAEWRIPAERTYAVSSKIFRSLKAGIIEASAFPCIVCSQPTNRLPPGVSTWSKMARGKMPRPPI